MQFKFSLFSCKPFFITSKIIYFKPVKDINYWIKKCEEQESIIKDNELRIYELEQEIEVLRKKNTGGIISRIFNW